MVRPDAQGPAFLMLQNFRVIMKYNPRSLCAGDRHLWATPARGEPLRQPWPRHERVLRPSSATSCSSSWHGRLRYRGTDGRLGQEPQRRTAFRPRPG